MRQLLHRCLLLVATLAVMSPALAGQGAVTVPRNLDQLTARAALIVRANVVSARVEPHPEFRGIDTVLVTLHVRETLKGDASGSFTFRQYLWDLRTRANAGGYRKGQDLLLMMIAPSRYGLSSPVGLDQGTFEIRKDASGREVAINGEGNGRLFRDLDAELAKEGVALSSRSSQLIATHRRGPVALGDLRQLIRELDARSRQR